MIEYRTTVAGITDEDVQGFFVGWPNPPSAQTLLYILHNAYKVVITVDCASSKVVGFTYAISDGILAAYIPLLEVLPAYQGKGIGKELMRRLTESLGELYMIDVVCDEDVAPFYLSLDFHRASGMMKRNYNRQQGGGI